MSRAQAAMKTPAAEAATNEANVTDDDDDDDVKDIDFDEEEVLKKTRDFLRDYEQSKRSQAAAAAASRAPVPKPRTLVPGVSSQQQTPPPPPRNRSPPKPSIRTR